MSSERLPDSPYQGLEPFTEADRAYFFGREEDQQTIGANLITSQLTVLYGASGVGKTSVLMAGVIPFVRSQPGVAVVLYRNWQVPDAFQELKAAIAAASGATDADTSQPLDQFLEEVGRRTRKTIAVIFDQFEEYLLYNPADGKRGRAFDAELARAVNREDIDANFLISIRDDAVARLDRFQTYIPDVVGNSLRLEHLDLEGARRAVEKPLAHYNEVAARRGEPDLMMDIEPELVGALLNEVQIGRVTVSPQAGKGQLSETSRVETPFLQMVLMKVWNAERAARVSILRAATFQRLGGAQKIVRDHVDSVMRSLTPAQREASSAIFDRLVTPSGSKIAYNAADLHNFAGEYGEAVPSLLERLGERDVRIVRAVAPAAGSTEVRYEIFHDVLSGALLAWRARYLREKEEAKAKRRANILGVVVLGIIAAAFLGAWWVEKRRGREHQQRITQAHDLMESGVNAHDVPRLESALTVYRREGDHDGEREALVNLGDVHVALAQGGDPDSKYKSYDAAVTAYEQALKLAATPDVAAKRLIALAGKRELLNDADGASKTYHDAAALLGKNGDAAGQVQALTKAAVTQQNAGNLAGAEADWRNALGVQQKQKTGDAETTNNILKGLASIEKQRKIARVTVLDVHVEGPPNPARKCMVKDLSGYWRQLGNAKALFIWKFAVDETGTALLHAQRTDGGGSGDFYFNGAAFIGTLQWVNGDALKDVRIFLPGDTNCNRIDTNQKISFVRIVIEVV